MELFYAAFVLGKGVYSLGKAIYNVGKDVAEDMPGELLDSAKGKAADTFVKKASDKLGRSKGGGGGGGADVPECVRESLTSLASDMNDLTVSTNAIKEIVTTLEQNSKDFRKSLFDTLNVCVSIERGVYELHQNVDYLVFQSRYAHTGNLVGDVERAMALGMLDCLLSHVASVRRREEAGEEAMMDRLALFTHALALWTQLPDAQQHVILSDCLQRGRSVHGVEMEAHGKEDLPSPEALAAYVGTFRDYCNQYLRGFSSQFIVQMKDREDANSLLREFGGGGSGGPNEEGWKPQCRQAIAVWLDGMMRLVHQLRGPRLFAKWICPAYVHAQLEANHAGLVPFDVHRDAIRWTLPSTGEDDDEKGNAKEWCQSHWNWSTSAGGAGVDSPQVELVLFPIEAWRNPPLDLAPIANQIQKALVLHSMAKGSKPDGAAECMYFVGGVPAALCGHDQTQWKQRYDRSWAALDLLPPTMLAVPDDQLQTFLATWLVALCIGAGGGGGAGGLSKDERADLEGTMVNAIVDGDVAKIHAVLQCQKDATGWINSVKLEKTKYGEKEVWVGDGHTFLHVAVALGHVEVVKGLLANGADKNAKEKDGYTPLHRAAFRGGWSRCYYSFYPW